MHSAKKTCRWRNRDKGHFMVTVNHLIYGIYLNYTVFYAFIYKVSVRFSPSSSLFEVQGLWSTRWQRFQPGDSVRLHHLAEISFLKSKNMRRRNVSLSSHQRTGLEFLTYSVLLKLRGHIHWRCFFDWMTFQVEPRGREPQLPPFV